MLIPGRKGPRDWTVLYYGGGVNNLHQDIEKAWTSLEGSELPPNVDTLVRHFDREGRSRDIHINPAGQLRNLGSTSQQVDSSDPASLSEFVRKGMAEYPAERFVLVVSSHGRGAEGVVEDDLAQEIMRPHELKEALEDSKTANQGRPLDLVLFDACRMAAVEVATELAGSALVSVASMDNIGDMGYNLKDVLKEASGSADALELGSRLVHNQNSQQQDALNSLSAVRLDKVKELDDAWLNLAGRLAELDDDALNLVREHIQVSRRNRASPLSEWGNDMLAETILAEPKKDNSDALQLWLENEKPGEAMAIGSFCKHLVADGTLHHLAPELVQSAKLVLEAHDQAVYDHFSNDGDDDPGGLTVLAPFHNEVGPLYDSPLQFEEMSRWETAFNVVLPDGESFEREKSWLEEALDKQYANAR